MTRIIIRQPKPSLFQPDKRETKKLSSSQLSLRTHTLPCIWKEIVAYQETHAHSSLGECNGFPLVILLAVGGHHLYSGFLQLPRGYGGIFAYLSNLMTKPWDQEHTTCIHSLLSLSIHLSSPSQVSPAFIPFFTHSCNLFISRCTSVSFNHLNRPLVPI